MKFFTQNDFDLVSGSADKEPDKNTHPELKHIYEKLEYLCKVIYARGFEYEIRKDPRRQAGRGKFVFSYYQWAKIFPKGLKSELKNKVSFNISITDSLDFKVMGIGAFEKHDLSEKAHKDSKTIVSIEGMTYEKVADEFQRFASQNLNLLLSLGASFGSSTSKKKLEIMKLQSIGQLLVKSKQLILQGPPGTGKTYTAKDIAEYLVRGEVCTDKKKQAKELKQSEQFKLVQFHPSYSYEDFVRGITAKAVDGQISYETENKLLAEFAERALNNQQQHVANRAELGRIKWAEEQLQKFTQQIGTIVEENGEYPITKSASIVEVENHAFRYDGKNWQGNVPHRIRYKDILEGYLSKVSSAQEFKALDKISGTAKQRYSYHYIVLEKFRSTLPVDPTIPNEEPPELRNYVLLIDEINRANLPAVLGELIYALEYRGEAVQSLYDIEGDRDIVLPDNLYIIGTMNTADRSVGHIDYAIRRRFAFVEMLPEVLDIPNFQKAAFEAVSALFVENLDKKRPSKYLSDEFKERPQDVWIGHSYFIAENDAFPMKLQYEIVPILEEYLKDGILTSDAKEAISQIAQGNYGHE